MSADITQMNEVDLRQLIADIQERRVSAPTRRAESVRASKTVTAQRKGAVMPLADLLEL